MNFVIIGTARLLSLPPVFHADVIATAAMDIAAAGWGPQVGFWGGSALHSSLGLRLCVSVVKLEKRT